jgi:hypothetical protein
MANFTWMAHYADLPPLPQFNDDGSENLFSKIDQDKLLVFSLGPYEVWVKEGIVKLKDVRISFGSFDSNRLIYFRRTSHTIGLTGGPTRITILQVFGLQATVDGVNYKVMFGVDEDDRVSILHE